MGGCAPGSSVARTGTEATGRRRRGRVARGQRRNVGALRLRGGTYLRRAAPSVGLAAAPATSVIVSLLAVAVAGIETWGVFLGSLILVRLSAQIANFGLREHLVRRFAGDPAATSVAWKRSIAARAPLLLIGPAAFLLAGAEPVRLGLMSVWLVALFVAQSYEPLVAYRRAFGLGLAAELAATVLTVVIIGAVGRALTPDHLIAAHGLAAAVRAAFLAARFPAFLPVLRPKLDTVELRAAWPFFTLSFTGGLQARADLFVVAAVLPAPVLGAYGVLTNFVLLTQSLSAALLAPVTPSLYRLPRRSVVGVAVRLFAVGIPLTLAATAVTAVLLQRLYGVFLDLPTMVAAWAAMLPPFLYAPLVYLRFRSGLAHLVVLASLGAAAVAAVGALILASRFGIAGAMTAAAISQACLALLHAVPWRPGRRSRA